MDFNLANLNIKYRIYLRFINWFLVVLPFRLIISYLITIKKRSESTNLPKIKIQDVAVIYLARLHTSEEIKSIDLFLESYSKYRSGFPHNLYILEKDNSNEIDLAAKIRKLGIKNSQIIKVSNDGFDLGSYREGLLSIDEEYCLCLNTFSQIEASDWLFHLVKASEKQNIRIAGCSASHGQVFFMRNSQTSYPNPHIRTTGFLIRKRDYLEYSMNEVFLAKEDTYLFESGSQSLTKRVLLKGGECIVVDKKGNSFEMNKWKYARIFMFGFKQDILISDNVSRKYEDSSLVTKIRMSFGAWYL